MEEVEVTLTGIKTRLRHLQLSDADFILQLVNTPGWLEFIGNKAVFTHEDAKLYLATGPLISYLMQGFGLYCVEDLSSRALGLCGLLRRDGLAHADLGFAFLPEHTGMGYATEAAQLVLAHWFKKNETLEIIDAITLPTNQKAIRLLKKLGFSYQETIRLHAEQEELDLYRLR
jgi:ribosomal-protein-alanine N-acetyltransferase